MLYIDEDNRIRITGVKDPDTKLYVNDAIATFDILDEDGVEIDGMTDLSLTNVAGSNGDYVGYLPKDSAGLLTEANRYYVAITLASSGRNMYRRVAVTAVYHGAT